MTVKTFLHSHEGKATVAVYLAALFLAWPPALSWAVAAALLVFAGRELREAFRRLDEAKKTAETPEEPCSTDTHETPHGEQRTRNTDEVKEAASASRANSRNRIS